MRADGRRPEQLRPTHITLDVQKFADASALIDCGDTRVLCAVSVEDGVPPFLAGRGRGWLTAEYRMLPRATTTRNARETRPRGRTQEIQRLIGRALRAVVDLQLLGERTLLVDCDVLQADGGTRVASITGACVAVHHAAHRLRAAGLLDADPVHGTVAAVSAGLVGDAALLDLCYEEDRNAEVDLNVAMTDRGAFVEVQGTAEGVPFSRAQLDSLLDLAADGIRELVQIQRAALP